MWDRCADELIALVADHRVSRAVFEEAVKATPWPDRAPAPEAVTPLAAIYPAAAEGTWF
jgi:hypothetical protein